MTFRIAQFLALALAFTFSAHAQRGDAEPGYYPFAYNGDTWTGTVSSFDQASKTITLAYEHKGKAESFTGITKPPVRVLDKDGSPVPAQTRLKIGDRITVYYLTDGKKHLIFQIKLLDPRKP